jgi:hypothetical protein
MARRQLKRNRKTRGIGVVDALVGTAILGILLLAMFALERVTKKTDQRTNVVGGIENIRTNIVQILRDQYSLKQTIQQTYSTYDATMKARFQCLYKIATQPAGSLFDPTTSTATPMGCTKNTINGSPTEPDSFNSEPGFEKDPNTADGKLQSKRPLVLARSDGSLFFNGFSSRSTGFAMDGVPCSTFSLTTPQDNCPVRYELEWSIECKTKSIAGGDQVCASCPILLVGGRVFFRPSDLHVYTTSVNAAGYGISPPLIIPLDSMGWCKRP